MTREFKPLPGGLITSAPASAVVSKAQTLAPELPFDEIWTPEPELNLVIPALGIAPGPAHLVTGSWYTGKTLLLATMGLCVASGRALFGLWGTKRGKWMHFDHEMGRRHLKRYVQRLQRGASIDTEELRGNVSLRVLPRLNLRTDNAVDYYSELLTGYSVATLDPLRAAAPGADENKSEFREYLDMLSIVSDRTGCSIVVLHHGGKPTEGAQRRNTGRGTSAIDDAVQSKFVLTAEQKGAPMLVTHEKTRELATTLDDFWLEIVNTSDSVTLVHRLPEEIGSRASDRNEAEEELGTATAMERIRAKFMSSNGRIVGTREEVLNFIGGRRKYVSAAFTKMKTLGEIEAQGSRQSPVFTLRSSTQYPSSTQEYPR